MKKWRFYWNISCSWILSTLLAMLGFTSCDDDEEEDIRYMYGTPTASFSIKGKVENVQGKALPGVRVVVPFVEYYPRDNPYYDGKQPMIKMEIRDTIYTDENGKFEWLDGAFPSDTTRYELQFDDMNLMGEGPHYQSDTLKVRFWPKDLQENGSTWNSGLVEKELTVVLKKKEDE